MAVKHEVSEIFMSLEGEAQFAAHPTVYIRFGRCNLKCPHFNNHNKEVTDKGYAPLGYDPKEFTSLNQVPIVTMGCDSQYAVNPAFAHIWEKLDTDELIDRLIDLLPRKSWVHPVTGLPVILSLTGGEPTLKWKFLPQILFHPKMKECKHILIETNCTVPFKSEFTDNITKWLEEDEDRMWTWSNSPKLSASGEAWEDAIKPEIAMRQLEAGGQHYKRQVNQYFKFVIGPRDEDLKEVEKAMDEYYAAGVPQPSPVWLMPEACTQDQQKTIDQEVAKMCMDHGYMFCYRFQNALWDNTIGS